MAKHESHQSMYPGSEQIYRGANGGHFDTLFRGRREPMIRFRERISFFYPQIARLDESEYNYILKTVKTAYTRPHDLSNETILPLGRWDDATTIWQVQVRGMGMIIAYKQYGPFPITPLPDECLYLHPGDNRRVFNDLYDLAAHLGDRMNTQIPETTSDQE